MKIAVDASALLAILLNEPDGDHYLNRLLSASSIWITPINWWEVQARMRAVYGPEGEARSDEWMRSIGLRVVSTTLAHAKIAAQASAKFRGRPARLNMGDCFAYALAVSNNIPLLYKGNDFALTDVRSA